MEHVLGLIVGIGLSAACGFRVFVPLLGMNVAYLSGHMTLSPGFEWIGSLPALVAFGTATLLEIIGYFIPWVDNLLDTAATPIAVVTATILTASQVGEMSPFLKWSLAATAGGGVCTVVQTGTVALRATSSGTTGGFANFLVAIIELVFACIVTVLANVVPILCFLGVIVLCGWMIWGILNSPWMKRRLQTAGADGDVSFYEEPHVQQLHQRAQSTMKKARSAPKPSRRG